MRRHLTLAIALWFSLLVSAQAETLSLGQAIELALKSHPQLRASTAYVDAAVARIRQAEAIPNPQIVGQAEEVRLGNPGQGVYQVGISQPLLIGGQQALQVQMANLDKAIAELRHQAVARNLAVSVRTAFAEVLSAGRQADLAAQTSQLAQGLLGIAQKQYDAGEVARYHVLRAEVALAEAQRNLTVAESQVQQAKARLNSRLGRSAQTPLDVQEQELPGNPVLVPLKQAVEQALTNRPDIQMAGLERAREETRVALAQLQVWEGASFSVSGGMAEGQGAVSAGFSLPIPLWNRQEGAIAEAEANVRRMEAERAELLNAVTLEVGVAHRHVEITRQQIDLFKSRLLPQAERLLDLAQRRFRLGEGSSLEVLEARSAYQETYTAFHQALLDLEMALAELDKATGQPLFGVTP